MSFFLLPCRARAPVVAPAALCLTLTLTLILTATVLPLQAADDPNGPKKADPSLVMAVEPPGSTTPRLPDEDLSLELARQLAVEQQPTLEAQALIVDAARESAVAAGQLPDPQLRGGLTDLTVTGPNVGTLTQQNDTQFRVGIAQNFPLPAKRRLRSERANREAALGLQQLQNDTLIIERDVGLLWLDVWKPQQALVLARASEREALLQLDATRIAYGSGRAPQSDVRAATVALELLRDEIAKLEQDTYHARGLLSRWLGDAAYRPVPVTPLRWPEPPPLAVLLENLRRHPHVGTATAGIDVAQADVALARQAYRPDFSVELGYGHRPAFSDYLSLQVGIDLPVFTANRQDRNLAARRAELSRAEALREDSYRQHAADARLNHWDWNLLGERLQHFDTVILPEAEARTDAARLAWASGNGTLASVLEARRAALEARLRRLDLETDRSRHALALRYLNTTGPSGAHAPSASSAVANPGDNPHDGHTAEGASR